MAKYVNIPVEPETYEKLLVLCEASGLKQRPHHDTLTEREFQILRLFARGASVGQIANTLTISSKTVSTHKARLMEKMGFSSNAEIVRYAISQRLIE